MQDIWYATPMKALFNLRRGRDPRIVNHCSMVCPLGLLDSLTEQGLAAGGLIPKDRKWNSSGSFEPEQENATTKTIIVWRSKHSKSSSLMNSRNRGACPVISVCQRICAVFNLLHNTQPKKSKQSPIKTKQMWPLGEQNQLLGQGFSWRVIRLRKVLHQKRLAGYIVRRTHEGGTWSN